MLTSIYAYGELIERIVLLLNMCTQYSIAVATCYRIKSSRIVYLCCDFSTNTKAYVRA